jgi:3'(2'), 5'-bisphosphate nucleotidase
MAEDSKASISSTDLDDHELAFALARGAGEILTKLRSQMDGSHPRALKDAGDRAAHIYLMSQLGEHRPNDAVLSEEGRDNPQRLTAERTWIVDPLDGTREFSEIPRTDWAVHVALVVDHRPVAGAVALPAQGITYSTAADGRTQADSGDEAGYLPPLAALPQRPRLVVSRTRPLLEAVVLSERLDGELVPMGSAGAKAMAVLRGEAEVYAHAGGQYEWDSCAPVAVAAAAGLHCSRLDGSPLSYNHLDPWLPDLLICHPELEPTVRELLVSMGW